MASKISRDISSDVFFWGFDDVDTVHPDFEYVDSSDDDEDILDTIVTKLRIARGFV